MTTSVLDNFNRANENPLNASNWGGDIFGRASHALGVLSNKCVNENAGLGNSASGYWLTSPASADQSCFIVPGPLTDGNYYYIAYVRLINAGTGTVSGYYMLANPAGPTLQIYRLDTGTGTELINTTVVWAQGDTLELRATGTTIAIYKNTVLAGSTTDATYSANGKIGVLFGPGGSTIGDTYLTSFDGTVAPTNTVAPVASGTATVGQTLSTTNGTWTGSPSFTYQWQRSGVNIGSATASTYVLVDADDALNVRCVVTGTNAGGSATGNSNALAITEPVPTNSVAGTVSGSAPVGSTLTATTGTWLHQGGTIATYAYQWTRDGSNIGSATSSTYITQAADVTHAVGCKVTATNTGGAGTPQASSNTITVTAPVASGTAATQDTGAAAIRMYYD